LLLLLLILPSTSHLLFSVSTSQDAATAKAVAFHRDVMMKCVTHDGDLFDPSGTLTGGSRATGSAVLAKLHALAEAEAQLAACAAALTGACAAARVCCCCCWHVAWESR
jgi:structural maintenance of chromosome 2